MLADISELNKYQTNLFLLLTPDSKYYLGAANVNIAFTVEKGVAIV